MLQNTFEQMSLTVPSDAVELSLEELEDINGAGSFGSGSFPFFAGTCASFLSGFNLTTAINLANSALAKFGFFNFIPFSHVPFKGFI